MQYGKQEKINKKRKKMEKRKKETELWRDEMQRANKRIHKEK